MGHAFSELQRQASGAGDPVVSVKRGGLSTSCRYCTIGALEQNYTIEPKVLGSGMNGEVLLAKSRLDGSLCAVKSFSKRGMSSKSRAELKSEAEIYLSLDHPHVARLNMVYETSDELHFVMEYMSGGELYDRLARKRRYTEEVAADTACQMLLAVSYLHSHNVVHRDLKLENFLYESPDTDLLKIIDFGFASFMERSTTMSQACGSVHYVAPEVLKKSYTEKADMWSMGVICFMTLIGRAPFSGTESAVLSRISKGSIIWPERFHRLSSAARDFLKSLLCVDPDERLSANQALDHSWITSRRQAQESVLESGVIDSLRRFARASKFRKDVLCVMAWSLSTEDLMLLRGQFLAIDHDNTGTISLQDFTQVLRNHPQIGVGEAEELFRSMDTNNSDSIEYSEFLAAAMLSNEGLHEKVLRRTFERFDINRDGHIDREELAAVLGGGFTPEEIEEIVKQADTSGDGRLDYDEFLSHFYHSETGGRTARRSTEKLGVVADRLIQEDEEAHKAVAAQGAQVEEEEEAEQLEAFCGALGAGADFRRILAPPLQLPTLLTRWYQRSASATSPRKSAKE